METIKPKGKRGFASMDPEKQRAIARQGGKSVPDEKRSFSQDPELAARAGSKGGKSVRPENRAFSRDHALAAEVGRKGGLSKANRTKPRMTDAASHGDGRVN